MITPDVCNGCDIYQLWFDPDHNKFTDNDGFLIFDVFRYVKPAIVFAFLKAKESTIIQTGQRTYVELFYPDEEDYFE